MSVDATMLFESLFRLAFEGAGEGLFGTSAPLAREAFRRALAGGTAPVVWLEVPLSGPPRFDLHVAHGNAALHEDAPFAPGAMDGRGELLNWYASEPREGGGIALAFDVGDGRVDAPAVHVNVNGAASFDAEGFFARVGRTDATALLDGFVARLPQGWRVWYFGVHPGRPGAPVRVDCFVDGGLKRAYAAEPAKLEEDLRAVGVAGDAPAAFRIGAEVAVTPFGMELQFDLLADGRLGQTVGVSAQFPFASAGAARPLWEPGGDAARLMERAEELGVADARWRRIHDASFAVTVQDGGISRALFCVPAFVKFRARADALLDAKVYLQAGTREL